MRSGLRPPPDGMSRDIHVAAVPPLGQLFFGTDQQPCAPEAAMSYVHALAIVFFAEYTSSKIRARVQ